MNYGCTADFGQYAVDGGWIKFGFRLRRIYSCVGRQFQRAFGSGVQLHDFEGLSVQGWRRVRSMSSSGSRVLLQVQVIPYPLPCVPCVGVLGLEGWVCMINFMVGECLAYTCLCV